MVTGCILPSRIRVDPGAVLRNPLVAHTPSLVELQMSCRVTGGTSVRGALALTKSNRRILEV
jgi:hypothetical protein